MKMEVRVFTAGPIMVDEITAWFKDQEPRIPITVSVVEREGESRTAVYALFLDAPVVTSVAVGDPVAAGNTVEYWQKDSAQAWDKCEERRLENEALLDLLEKWTKRSTGATHDTHPELDAKTAELLKKAGRA